MSKLKAQVRRVPHSPEGLTPIKDCAWAKDQLVKKGYECRITRMSRETLRAFSRTEEWQARVYQVCTLFGEHSQTTLEAQWEVMTNTKLVIDDSIEFGKMGVEP